MKSKNEGRSGKTYHLTLAKKSRFKGKAPLKKMSTTWFKPKKTSAQSTEDAASEDGISSFGTFDVNDEGHRSATGDNIFGVQECSSIILCRMMGRQRGEFYPIVSEIDLSKGVMMARMKELKEAREPGEV